MQEWRKLTRLYRSFDIYTSGKMMGINQKRDLVEAERKQIKIMKNECLDHFRSWLIHINCEPSQSVKHIGEAESNIILLREKDGQLKWLGFSIGAFNFSACTTCCW